MTQTTTTIIQLGPIRLVRVEIKTLPGGEWANQPNRNAPGLAKCGRIETIEADGIEVSA